MTATANSDRPRRPRGRDNRACRARGAGTGGVHPDGRRHRQGPGRIESGCRYEGAEHSIDSAKAAERAGVAYIPGDRKREGVFPNLSVFENFGMPRYRRTSRAGFIDRRKVHRMFLEQIRGPLDPRRAGRRLDQLTQRRQSAESGDRPFAGRIPAGLGAERSDSRRGHSYQARPLRPVEGSCGGRQDGALPLQRDRGVRPDCATAWPSSASGSVSAVLTGDQITNDAVLAAMFGHVTPQTRPADQEQDDGQA